MKRTNEIIICRDGYDSQEKFEAAIKDAVIVLLNNNYIMTVKYDEKGLGIVAIEYDSAEQELGNTYPFWLTPREYESVTPDDGWFV